MRHLNALPLSFSLLFGFTSVSTPADALPKTKKSKKKPKVEVLEQVEAVADPSVQVIDEVSEPESAKVRRTKTGKRIRSPAEEDTVSASASEVKRESQTMELNIEPIGFTPFPTQGLYAGYFITPNQILTLRGGQASGIFSDDKETILSVGLKSFWGNSFFTHAALSSRSYELKYSMFMDNETFDIYEMPLKPSAIGAEFSIGNQWQWSNFTLGTEWVGFFMPFSTSGTDFEGSVLAGTDEASVKRVKADIDSIKRSQIAFLRFYLGVTF